MKVKYIGTAKDINLVGVGLIQPNDVLEVSQAAGEQLIQRPDFVEFVEKPKVRRRAPRPKPTPFVPGTEEPVTIVSETEKEEEEESEPGGE